MTFKGSISSDVVLIHMFHLSPKLVSSVFSKWRGFRQIRWNRRIGQIHPRRNRIQLQPQRNAENIPVQLLEYMTAKQAIWIKFLVMSLNFLLFFCSICLIRLELWKTRLSSLDRWWSSVLVLQVQETIKTPSQEINSFFHWTFDIFTHWGTSKEDRQMSYGGTRSP